MSPIVTAIKRRKGKHVGIGLLACVFPIILIITVIARAIEQGYDNDMWFILATGRRIVERGIPYVNPFSVYKGMAFVAQQWLICVIHWLAWSVGGMVGMGVVMLAMCVLLLLSMAFVTRETMQGKAWAFPTLCVAAVTIICTSSYMSFRPQMVTMVLMLVTIGIMERYRHTNDARTLAWLIPLMILHANTHMSMMWMDVAIVVCYALPSGHAINGFLGKAHGLYARMSVMLSDADVPTGEGTDSVMRRSAPHAVTLADDGYARKPIWIAILGMVVASCVNPYGIDGALYLVHSYGAAGYGNYISEMGNLTPLTAYYGVMLIVMVVLGAMAIGKRGIHAIDMPMTLMVLGTVYISFQHVRSVWILPVFAFPFVVKTLCVRRADDEMTALPVISDGTHANDDSPYPSLIPSLRITITVCVIAIAVAFAGMSLYSLGTTEQYSDSFSTPVNAMEWLNRKYPSMGSRSKVQVCTMFNMGGYVEYNGYLVSIDPRPETWNDAISKDRQDRYNAYVDAVSDNGGTTADKLVKSAYFDYVIASSNSHMEQAALDEGYVTMMTGNGYVLLGKKGNGSTAGQTTSTTQVGGTGNTTSMSDSDNLG